MNDADVLGVIGWAVGLLQGAWLSYLYAKWKARRQP